MSDQSKIKPMALALGATFAVSLSSSPLANAAGDNPFSMTDLKDGYTVAGDEHEGRCGEGKCGDKEGEGKCGEGKCGDKKGEGKCGDKEGEGKCGEGKCGDKEGEGKCGEGKCGDDKKAGHEGKCGEGRCGG